MELNPKQEKFCLEYAKTGHALESYMTAYGQTDRKCAQTGSVRLMKLPKIQNRIREINSQVVSSSIADISEIKERLTAILRQTAEEEVLMTEGVEKGVTQTVKHLKKADLRTVTKAAELLAKMAGAFNDGNTVNVGVQVVINDDLDA